MPRCLQVTVAARHGVLRGNGNRRSRGNYLIHAGQSWLFAQLLGCSAVAVEASRLIGEQASFIR
jgi:hypothetical protein